MDLAIWCASLGASALAYGIGWLVGVRANRRMQADAEPHLYPEDEWMR
ncbi:hypothetical protein LWE61_15090 [Sphingobium sufflavum]|nr:hypothetical protein [Sphingobium sufflavum]MCE7797874.1 hypothetical protein [Sphingobium sufflavum]